MKQMLKFFLFDSETIGIMKRLSERLQRIFKPHRVDSLLSPSPSLPPRIRNQVLTPPKLVTQAENNISAQFSSNAPQDNDFSSTTNANTKTLEKGKPQKFVSFRSPLKRRINGPDIVIKKNISTHVREERSESMVSHVAGVEMIVENGLKLCRSISL